jgi:hypothetical protein
MCLQVLEHIPGSAYEESLTELERITSKYLLIGVPYRERLEAKQSLCAACGEASHADGHLRSYTGKSLGSLFRSFELLGSYQVGVLQRRKSLIVCWLEHNLSSEWHSPEIFCCPYCGSRQSLAHRFNAMRASRVTVSLARRLLSLFTPEMPYWIIGLYGRKDGL